MSENRQPELETLFAQYVDRMNDGEAIDAETVLAENPLLGAELLEYLDEYLDAADTGGSNQPLGTLGDYTLRRQIGRGGMGVVYEAWQNSMDRQVALKVLPVGLAADERAFQRFMREARTAGRLDHPNVVHVHGLGIEEQTPYYAMEFVEGETLAQILANTKDAEPETETPFGKKDSVVYFGKLADAFADVADGLQHAHQKGVTHRDIKPSNLILDQDGRLRILDFGLARLEGQEPLTLSGDFVGTPLYMSPEQARRKKIPVDHRTDVYSLGATMYEAVCGRPPFRGKDHADTLSQIIERDPVEPRGVNSRVPKDLETIVLKCLRKDSGDRYGTAEALGQDLRRFVRGDSIEARPRSQLEVQLRRLWRCRWGVVAAAFVCTLIGVTALFLQSLSLRERERHRAVYDKDVEDAALAVEAFTCTASLGRGNLSLVDPYGTLDTEFKYFLPRLFQREHDSIASLIESLTRDARLLPERPEAHYFKAKVLALLDRDPEARGELKVALEKDPTFVPARILADSLGSRRETTHDHDSRKREARGPGKTTWQTLWRAAHRALSESRWDEAGQTFAELYRVYERDGEPYAGAAVEVLLARGRARLEAEDYRRAIEDLATAKNLLRGVVAPVLLLGKAYYLARQEEGAEETFEELLDDIAAPGEQWTGDPAVLVSHLYISLKDWGRAYKWAERIGDKAVSEAVKASCLTNQGKHELAVSAARKAISLDSSLLHGHVVLGVALQYQGKFEEAETVFNSVIESSPRYAPAYAYLGHARCQQRRWKEGYPLLKRALELGPDFYQARKYLGEAYMRQGLLTEAKEQFETIVERHPREIHAHVWLGWVYMKMGRHKEARSSFEQALHWNPEYDLAHYCLGVVHLEQGRSADGINAFCRAIEVNPGRRETYLSLVPHLAPDKKLECAEEVEKLIELVEKALDDMEYRSYVKAVEATALASWHVPTKENLSRSVRILEKACRLARERGEEKGNRRLAEELQRHRDALSTLGRTKKAPAEDAETGESRHEHPGQ